ncbi:MAG: hypothetical protein ACOYMB_01135 [Patescibacteria group bacterium]
MIGIHNKQKKGSALLMTMLILFGIIAVAFGGASLVISGLRSSDLSAKSTVAYYNAEAGAERLLAEVRSGRFDLATSTASSDHFVPIKSVYYNTLENGGNYYVDYDQAADFGGKRIIFSAIGDYKEVKRSVEVSF